MQDGLTKKRESYFDDSSKTLGLSRRAEIASVPAEMQRGGIPVAQYAGPIQQADVAERARILAVEREIRDAEIAKLVAQGCTPKQAAEIFGRELTKHGKDRKALERSERRQKATEDLMDVRKKPAKPGSSSSGRKRAGKKGTWICQACNLEFCGHRPKGGRPNIGGRSVDVSAKVSADARIALSAGDISAGEIVEAIVMAAEAAHCSPRDVLAMLAQPAAPEIRQQQTA